MDTKFRVECSHCGQAYRLNPDLAGKQVKCKNCGLAFRVAAPGSAPPPIPPPSPAQDDLFAAPAQDDLFAGLGGAPIAPASLPPGTIGGFQQPSMRAANAPAKTRVPMSQRRRPDPATDSDDDDEPWNQKVAPLVFFLGLIVGMSSVPGWGFGFEMSAGGYFALMMFFGMVSFAMYDFQYWIPGLVGGAIAGAGSLLAMQVTLRQVESIYILALVVIEVLGALPGMGLYLAGKNMQDSIVGD